MAKSGMSESDVESEDGKKPTCKSNNKYNSESPDDSICIIRRPVKTSTPISILIESLVKNICYLYESNAETAKRNYTYICEKLYDMKLIDESYDMNEFEGMRNQYQRALHHLLVCARGGEQTVPIQPIWPNTDITNDWSHYYREFDEIGYIAGGGFGKVYRVKHKLDGTEYAVKKIYIRSEGIKSVMNYLSEVKTFASLNHSNIVQYKAAWLELDADTGKNIITEHTSDSDYSYTGSETVDKNEKVKNHLDINIIPSMISSTLDTTFQQDKNDSDNFEVSFESTKSRYSYSSDHALKKNCVREKRKSISEGGNAVCTLEEIHKIKIQNRTAHTKWATLYIQMALCQSTLKQWLEKRNMTDSNKEKNDSALIPIKGNVRTDTIMEILRQLLQGLEYIHSKHIVHHDIKPSNIFVQSDNSSLLVQLGDFGLACPLQSARHSLALGTKLYAAPEQLNGKCDPKSDMYSLGIVVLELTETFKTDMERVQSISQLRKGNLSSHLLVQQPQLAHIIGQLVTINPKDRPDASTLLKRITIDVVESDVVRDLKYQIAKKDEEILRLRELLKTAGVASD